MRLDYLLFIRFNSYFNPTINKCKNPRSFQTSGNNNIKPYFFSYLGWFFFHGVFIWALLNRR